MNSIELLVREHDNILSMLDVLHAASLRVLGGEAADVGDFKRMIDFIRKYADKTHHGKEEEFLFERMLGELGAMGDNLIRGGMLVEHDIGRLYVSDLDAALDAYAESPADEARLGILVSAGAYERLLRRHIQKENEVVFPFGEKKLSPEALEWVQERTRAFEEDTAHAAERGKQLISLDYLSKKYCP